MRRNARRRTEEHRIWEDKRIVISGAGIAIAIITGFTVYSNGIKNSNLGENVPNPIISLESENGIENTESASSSIGNTVKQPEESNNTNVNEASAKSNTVSNTNTSAKDNTNTVKASNSTKVEKETTTTNSSADNKDEKVSFDWPVKGEILKAFSMDNLLFSSTLQEWTTHNGIDIKANKASVVFAAADGTVKSIKNDPRYGLTVTIEHSNGYKTVYSNLLTAEFVVEGEKVKKGQSIGTVGNTANFEVADDFHLHFEILKDSECVDPMIYLK